MKKFIALLISILLLLNVTPIITFAQDSVLLDFENSGDLSSFELWDDENESSMTISSGGVDGGSCLKFVSERQATKSWLPATVTYTFASPKKSGTQVVELYAKIPSAEQGNTKAKHVINVSNSKGVRAGGSELNFEMSEGKAKQIITRASGGSAPDITTYDDDWHKYTFVINIDSRKIKFYQDDVEKAETEFRREDGTQPEDGYLNTFDITTNDAAYIRTIYIDKFKVSDSYTPPENGGEEPDTGGDNEEIVNDTSIDFENESWKDLLTITNIASSSDGIVEFFFYKKFNNTKYLSIFSVTQSGGDPTVTYSVPEKLQKTTGNIVFEFDAMWPATKEEIPTGSNVPQIMLNAYNSDGLSELSMAMKRDFFDQHITRSGSTTTSRLNGIAYENEWHKYTFVLNLDDREITYYEDDTELGTTEFRRDSAQAGKAITTLAFVVTVKPERRAIYIDNFSVSDTYTPKEDGGGSGDGEGGGNTGEENDNEILSEGFDAATIPSGFSVTSGNVSIEENEAFGGNALKISKNDDSTKETEIKFGFAEQKKVSVEFDVMLVTSNSSLKTSIDLISSDKIAGTSWGMSLSLTASALNNKTLKDGTTNEAALSNAAIEANKKYNLKFIADSKNGAERGSFDYYIDGKYAGTADLRLENVPCFKTLVFKMPAGAGSGDFLYIDNLKINAIKIPEIISFDVLAADGTSLGEITTNVPCDVSGIDFKLDLMDGAFIEDSFSGIEFDVDGEKRTPDVSFDKTENLLKIRFKETLGYEKDCKLILAGVTDSLKSILPTETLEFKTQEPPIKYIVKLFDENDDEITAIPENGGTVKVRVSIKNNTSDVFKGAVICSVYSDGELLDITQKIPETLASQIGSASFEVTVPEDGDNYIGVYFWNDCKEMKRNADTVFFRQ